ncbi:MAG: hypothetical protein HY674_13490 [Chloroflexi bacterium]|nr:hypothetical protein [Chloroflexota bacterium]
MSLLLGREGWSKDDISTNSSSLFPGDALAETNQTAPRPALAPSLPQNDLLKAPTGPTPEFPVLDTNGPPDAVTNAAPAPLVLSELTGLASNFVSAIRSTNSQDRIRTFQLQLDQARQKRRDSQPALANRLLISLLETNAPAELKRAALLELALVAQGDNQLLKAQQIFAQFVRLYPLDPRVPEVLLRQGLLYRQLGVSALALSKFYAVMTSALALKLDQIDYYQRLVLQAQTEIADTYYLEGKHAEAADFFQRLLKLDSPELNRVQIQFKLIRSWADLGRHTEVVAQAQDFIERYASAVEQPEVRFQLATALKQLGRNREAMRQVLVLLESQQSTARQAPENWIYWQQRTGNEIANQLYREGDYLSALEIYMNLSELNKSPAWQLPVWYQIGLVFERLEQPQKASEIYGRVIGREKELTEQNAAPSLLAMVEMAKWRKDYLSWHTTAERTSLEIRRASAASPSGPAQP